MIIIHLYLIISNIKDKYFTILIYLNIFIIFNFIIFPIESVFKTLDINTHTSHLFAKLS